MKTKQQAPKFIYLTWEDGDILYVHHERIMQTGEYKQEIERLRKENEELRAQVQGQVKDESLDWIISEDDEWAGATAFSSGKTSSLQRIPLTEDEK